MCNLAESINRLLFLQCLHIPSFYKAVFDPSPRSKNSFLMRAPVKSFYRWLSVHKLKNWFWMCEWVPKMNTSSSGGRNQVTPACIKLSANYFVSSLKLQAWDLILRSSQINDSYFVFEGCAENVFIFETQIATYFIVFQTIKGFYWFSCLSIKVNHLSLLLTSPHKQMLAVRIPLNLLWVVIISNCAKSYAVRFGEIFWWLL